MQTMQVIYGTPLWRQLTDFAQGCSWIAGPHLAGMLRRNAFTGVEAVFAAVDNDGNVAGFCTLLREDYYPENRYSPWISSMFVREDCRHAGLCGQLIATAERYAASQGITRTYIPSDITGLYEKYGYARIDELVNYGGDTDQVFMKELHAD